jgi:hypothetical protein
MTLTPTPTEELEMRQLGAKVWSSVRGVLAETTELTPEQAFTEGYLLAFWYGVVAVRKERLEAEQRIQRLRTAMLLLQLAVWAAITWAMAR